MRNLNIFETKNRNTIKKLKMHTIIRAKKSIK